MKVLLKKEVCESREQCIQPHRNVLHKKKKKKPQTQMLNNHYPNGHVVHHKDCGCPRTEDEVEELQHWCGNAIGHGLEEEGHPRGGRDESKYYEAI